MLRASFVRTVGERDRIYVTRSDGSTVSWAFPTYADALPHDLVHLVVESAFGQAAGFWGSVDRGVDPGAALQRANQAGGRQKLDGFGADRRPLLVAEALANLRWMDDEQTLDHLRAELGRACQELAVPAPEVTDACGTAVRGVLGTLAARWRGLRPKGALDLVFDPLQPTRGFDRMRA